jgi:hypothetical protein
MLVKNSVFRGQQEVLAALARGLLSSLAAVLRPAAGSGKNILSPGACGNPTLRYTVASAGALHPVFPHDLHLFDQTPSRPNQ